ncbi:uncharacterized protein PRCAT00001617001 [Priceomyces carsonii]|uniref:uncharacterized protein n=1 Tax=Priceomyces carsonii TaxID=28549 RepID=UPI002ED8F77E|nr:unnamed protein product [Priceomyces carsonii]
MNSNIDPTITELDLFQTDLGQEERSLDEIHGRNLQEHHEVHSDDRSVARVFGLNEYVTSPNPLQPGSQNENSTAAAALNIIQLSNYNGEESASTINHEDFERFANSPYDDFSGLGEIKRNLRTKPSAAISQVKLVQYNPIEKTKRLGRPRKHMTKSLPSPENSSSQNYNESIISKFRFDTLPVEGPGSRGGRRGVRPGPRGRIGIGSLRQRQHQSTLSFNNTSSNSNLGLKIQKHDSNEFELQKLCASVQCDVELTLNESKKERNLDTKEKKNSRIKGSSTRKNSRFLKLTPISRTTILRNRSCIKGNEVEPVIGLNFDLYDDNVLKAEQNLTATSESLALGFPVTVAPYASDILKIISFLYKFKDIVLLDKVGPQNIESGLSLPFKSQAIILNTSASMPAVEIKDYDSNYVSSEMDLLFNRLMLLILNQEKISSISNSILQLRLLIPQLGLPSEWRSSKSNPFNSTEFEKEGLRGINDPTDRLIMLRVLVDWSLITSDDVRKHINEYLVNQNSYGETSYVARSVLKGLKGVEDTSEELKNKKLKSVPNDDQPTVGPTSNPLDHNLRLRLEELFAGDCGFHIGRFYLARMADSASGGLDSSKIMKEALKVHQNSGGSSLFKLYVLDVHEMLVTSLTTYGVEFDEEGEELPARNLTGEHWYEVANNIESLGAFVHYLSLRLGIKSSEEPINVISRASTIYKPVLSLLNYLSFVLEVMQKYDSHTKDLNLHSISQLDYG